MVDKDWNAEALIDVGGPIISLPNVLESEKCYALAVSCVEEHVFDPSFFAVVKFGVYQGKPEKVFVKVTRGVEVLS